MILRTLVAALLLLPVHAAEDLPQRAETALRRGVDFFRREAAVQGTYLWQYSADFKKREGEGIASPTQAWVQPPGTPAVGAALLAAWEATADTNILEAARATAHGLIRGQLLSGGWSHSFELDPELRKKSAYRAEGRKRGRNVTTFDDDSTQAALRFLMRADAALEFRDDKIHEAVAYALEHVLKAQYPNGAWAQGYDEFPEPAQFPVLKADYPGSWSREWPGSGQYWKRYTLNDNALATLIDTLFEAERVYGDSSEPRFAALAAACRAAAEKAGDFLILAQMPDPQPAWAQQYDFQMHPAWARKFEPPAITAGESQSVLRILLKLYRDTGKQKYLAPVPRALAWLESSRLTDGRLARFYELRSNKPLYFTRDYKLTYDDSDYPTHYAFKISDQTTGIRKQFERLRDLGPDELARERAAKRPVVTPALEASVRQVISSQDDRGAWVEEGKLRYHGPNDETRQVIRSATFIRNTEVLSDYLRALRAAGKE